MKKILYVDDEKFLADMMKVRLEDSGYEMTAAYSGEEGLEKIGREKPDLILLDMILPGLDGLAVCRKLKADPGTRGIPVIIFSAADKAELSEKSSSAGADDFIIKPFEFEELLDKIVKLLNRSSLQ